jgi:hypothetical protein
MYLRFIEPAAAEPVNPRCAYKPLMPSPCARTAMGTAHSAMSAVVISDRFMLVSQ